MKKITNKLSLAACSLLSQNAQSAEVIDNAWDIDSSMLYYDEANDRVAVTKFVLSAKGNITSNDSATLKAVLDTMSGATPSGAVQNSSLTTGGTTFTGASGGGFTANGQSSALVEFDDTRTAMSLDWDHRFNRTYSVIYNGAISVENDYRSFSAAATFNAETDNKAWKFTAGAATTYDEIFRLGSNDTPVPLSQVTSNESFGEGERTTIDLIAGLTQVINQRTVAQYNYAASTSQGYHTDPYKVFSITDAASGSELDQYFESRPSSRRRNSLTLSLNHQVYPSNNVIHSSYRYYWDNWDVNSHTLDFSYKYKYGSGWSLQPNLRLYTQSKAFFYTNSLPTDAAVPTPASTIISNFGEFVSADYRLDDMDSVTLGATLGYRASVDSYFRARLEYMYQSFDNAEFDENRAIIGQISYNRRF